jgi:hypothetical protein
VIRQGYNYSNYQISTTQPTVKTFVSPSASEALKISISPPNSYASIIQVAAENIPQTSLSNFPIRCPSANYTYTGTNGPSVFADPQINFGNLSNYLIQRMPQNGWYYLVNKTNPADLRQLYFVDRGDGQGGLVFFAATQTPYNQDPPSSTQWYFTGYARNSNDDIRFTPEVFTKTQMTPAQYARIVNKTVIKYFESPTI